MNTLRKRSAFALAVMVFLPASYAAAQTLLIDTGQPTGGPGPVLCAATCGSGSTFQNLAGQFTLSSANSISSAQAGSQYVGFFAFNSGPNSGPTGPLATDANGNAVFTYTDNGGAGIDMVQATVASLTATSVPVTWTAPGPLDHITISPATATIVSGNSQLYTASSYDGFNNSIGDVTSQTTFAIAPDGSCTLANCRATVTGPHTVNGTYSGKSAQASLTVNASGGKTNPVITWPTPAPITYAPPVSSKQLDATANTPGEFVYSPKAGTILKAGSQKLSVTFTPANTSAYNTVTATVSLQVNQAKPIVLCVPLPLIYPNALGPFQLDASPLVPGSFAYNPSAGTVLSVGQHTLSAVFTPKDATDFQTVTVKAVVEVIKPKH